MGKSLGVWRTMTCGRARADGTSLSYTTHAHKRPLMMGTAAMKITRERNSSALRGGIIASGCE